MTVTNPSFSYECICRLTGGHGSVGDETSGFYTVSFIEARKSFIRNGKLHDTQPTIIRQNLATQIDPGGVRYPYTRKSQLGSVVFYYITTLTMADEHYRKTRSPLY